MKSDVHIRRLWRADKAAFRDHLLRLDPASRADRFSGGVSDEFLIGYAENCFGAGDLVFGAFVDGQLRGAGELRSQSAIWTERAPFAHRVEAEAAFSVEDSFRRRGIGFKLGTRFERAEPTDDGVRVHLGGGETLDAELLLVAVCRGPSSAGLGYEEQGVSVERGFVSVDEYCRTSAAGVYAVGDLISTSNGAHPQLAHVGFAEGILVAEHLAGLPVVPIDYPGVPRITYSHPEVASVGYTEAQAADRYGPDNISTVTYDLSGNGRSAILGTKGAVKVVAAKDGPVLGIHIVGDRVGELIAEAQLIYNWEALPAEVAQLIHPHPTQSEAIGEAHLLLAGKPLHVHD